MFACGSIRFGGCICDNGPDSGNNCEKHIHNSWQLCLFSISVLIKNNASCWRQRKQMKEKNANSLISERKLNCVCCFHYAVPFQLALLFCFSFLTSVFFFFIFFHNSYCATNERVHTYFFSERKDGTKSHFYTSFQSKYHNFISLADKNGISYSFIVSTAFDLKVLSNSY